MVSVGPQDIIKQHLWSVGASTRHDQRTSCGVRRRKERKEIFGKAAHGSGSRGAKCCLRVWRRIITGVLCKVKVGTSRTSCKRHWPLTSMCLYPLLHWLSYGSNSHKQDWLDVLLLVDDVCLINCAVLDSIATFTFLSIYTYIYMRIHVWHYTRMCLPPASIPIVLPDRIDFMFGLAAGSCLINCVLLRTMDLV